MISQTSSLEEDDALLLSHYPLQEAMSDETDAAYEDAVQVCDATKV
ncbi:hypothetical protein BH10BAC2_BH10BAC2_38180 [soil metagenome]